MSLSDPYMTWWVELCKADKREPHPPHQCESIASSSPMALWECPICHQCYLALRQHPYICSGGFRSRRDRNMRVGAEFGFRRENLQNLDRIASYSMETGSAAQVNYHQSFLSQNTHEAWRWK